MRVLVLSSVFPSATRPTFGVFVRERVRHVAARCEIVVVAPIPWFPFNQWIRSREEALTPPVEVGDGITVYHPRFVCLPALGKCFDGVLYFLSVLPFLSSLRRCFPFDLIDAHFTYPDGVAAVLLAKWFRCPSIITVRGSHDLRHARYRFRRVQIRLAMRAATRVIAVSESLRATVTRLGVDRDVRVIPNGVDLSRFRPGDRRAARSALGLPQDQAVLISVGNLVEGKGHHRVVEMLPDLVSRRPDLFYVAVGEPARGNDSRGTIEDLVRRHGLAKHVRIVPARPHAEIPVWLAAADLFCLATRSEGWCNAVTEALACGLPVVTTRVGGNTELVRDGHDGLLVPFWDGRAFARAVLRALDTPWDRAGIAGRMQSYGWDQTADQVVEEFHSAIAVGERRGPVADPDKKLGQYMLSHVPEWGSMASRVRPAVERQRLTLKGVSHIHSTYSFDGELPLHEVKTFFAAKGFDFVLMSEHIETMTVETVRSFISDCRRLSTDRFLLMPGLEIEVLNLLILGVKEIEEYRDLHALIKQFQSQGALFVLSHPAKLHADALAKVSEIIEGVEVWNSKYDGKLAPRRKSLSLYRALRERNRSLVGSCGLDFHRCGDYAEVRLEVSTDERSEDALLSALRAGHFQIALKGRPIPIYDEHSRLGQAFFTVKSLCYTTAYDMVSYINRGLNRMGISAPGPLKRLAKKVF